MLSLLCFKIADASLLFLSRRLLLFVEYFPCAILRRGCTSCEEASHNDNSQECLCEMSPLHGRVFWLDHCAPGSGDTDLAFLQALDVLRTYSSSLIVVPDKNLNPSVKDIEAVVIYQ